MAKLTISELSPAGAELFEDSENFLEELSDREVGVVVGGADLNSVVTQNSVSVGSIQTATVVGISQTNVSVYISNVNASNVNVNVNATI
jgi:soluble P-type ATPase